MKGCFWFFKLGHDFTNDSEPWPAYGENGLLIHFWLDIN